MAQRWLPLESNPDVMNKYVQALGVPPTWEFTDVYGFDQELLMMVPRPVIAVVLLYPITEKAKSKEIGTVEENSSLYFIKQTIGNACGTIGLIHAVLNNKDILGLSGDMVLPKFLEATKDMSPKERAEYLEKDLAFGAAHKESAQEGQTQAPSLDDEVKNHFVAFVNQAGTLYEFDGRKDGPVNHGETTADTLLEDAAAVVKKFMARDPDSLSFTVVALSKAD